METIKNKPLTIVLIIITIISNAWNLLIDNAEILNISSKTIAIGSIVLTSLMMVYNALKNPFANDKEE